MSRVMSAAPSSVFSTNDLRPAEPETPVVKPKRRTRAERRVDKLIGELVERTRPTNQKAIDAMQRRQDAAKAASDLERMESPVTCTLRGGGLRVDVRLSDTEMNTRSHAWAAVKFTANRLMLHEEARLGAVRARSLGATSTRAASPEELSAFLSDEIRGAIKLGVVTIAIEKAKRAPRPRDGEEV